MKEFFNKYRKEVTGLLIVVIILLLLGFGWAIYFFVLEKGGNREDSLEQTTTMEDSLVQEETVSQPPDYDIRSSTEAVEATYKSAKEWSEDVKLYDCSGLPTSVEFPNISYDFIGAELGKYYRWMCTYYSESKAAIKIFVYEEDMVNDESEPMDIGEDGYLIYGNVDYPTDLSAIVDSELIYATALEQGLDEIDNYVNMYLMDLSDYGFVWNVEERSKTELDEYNIGAIVNTYIFDIYTGELQDILQEEVY